MNKKDKLIIAALAATVGKELKGVDASMQGKSAQGQAAKINPRTFIGKNINKKYKQTTQPINNKNFIEAPKSQTIGVEQVGNEQININDLVSMPTDNDMQERINKILQAEQKGTIPAIPNIKQIQEGKVKKGGVNSPPITPPPSPPSGQGGKQPNKNEENQKQFDANKIQKELNFIKTELKGINNKLKILTDYVDEKVANKKWKATNNKQ